jgi:allantoin racemase
MLHALTMGRKFGLVTIDPLFVDWHERQVRGHNLERRFAGVRALHMDLPRFMKAFAEAETYAEVRREFVDQVRPLVAAGAEVVIPAGGLPMLLFSRESGFEIDGAPVLNGIAVAAKAAEMALDLRRHGATAVSRRGAYAKASHDAVKEFMGSRW